MTIKEVRNAGGGQKLFNGFVLSGRPIQTCLSAKSVQTEGLSYILSSQVQSARYEPATAYLIIIISIRFVNSKYRHTSLITNQGVTLTFH